MSNRACMLSSYGPSDKATQREGVDALGRPVPHPRHPYNGGDGGGEYHCHVRLSARGESKGMWWGCQGLSSPRSSSPPPTHLEWFPSTNTIGIGVNCSEYFSAHATTRTATVAHPVHSHERGRGDGSSQQSTANSSHRRSAARKRCTSPGAHGPKRLTSQAMSWCAYPAGQADGCSAA